MCEDTAKVGDATAAWEAGPTTCVRYLAFNALIRFSFSKSKRDISV